jgi:WhiB family redox-sensing transcriptional regulator
VTAAIDVILLSDRAEDQGWKALGLCRFYQPNLFYPERGRDVRPAKRVCGMCPARLACLSYALRRNERLGIWGGLTERERRRVRRGLPLSITCRFCGHDVKAGRLGQVTCNRQACREAHRRWVDRQQVVVVVQLSFGFDVPTSVAELAAAAIVAEAEQTLEAVAV